jgi:hypothetical protein
MTVLVPSANVTITKTIAITTIEDVGVDHLIDVVARVTDVEGTFLHAVLIVLGVVPILQMKNTDIVHNTMDLH